MAPPHLSQNLTLCFARGSQPTPIIATSTRPAHIPKNHILIVVDRFGFSANNVTYQALGEHPHYRYFDFHAPPTTSSPTSISPKTHGVVPVWGFGTVIASSLSLPPSLSKFQVQVGERLYGYLAPTRYLLVEIDPKDVNKYAMYVPREYLPPDRRPYNQFIRCSTDPVYRVPIPSSSPPLTLSEIEDLIMLYRPLFWTSFWAEDWIWWEGWYGDREAGAQAVSRGSGSYNDEHNEDNLTFLISSASSKTAFCFAYCVGKRVGRGSTLSGNGKRGKGKVTLIGLTSPKNLEFTKRLGLYDEVWSYERFGSESNANGNAGQGQGQGKWIYIDVLGSSSLNARVYKHFESPYMGEMVLGVSLGMSSASPTSMTTTSSASSTSGGIGSGILDPKGGSTMSMSMGMSAGSTQGGKGKSIYPPKLESFFTPEWLEIRRARCIGVNPSISTPMSTSGGASGGTSGGTKTMTLQEYNKAFHETQKVAWEGLMRNCVKVPWVRIERVYNGGGGVNENKIKDSYEHIAKEGIPADRGLIWSMWSGEGDVGCVVGEAVREAVREGAKL
ncbi:hypothetical protein D9758_003561 [Tetrapyrgos nigripes]|uniref:Uncharacterized protein n=1 Tax=Tetrapyrgos nigripes TaxID=182062 RepID=A0A8H5GV99_9AGAR|nr:hypothetical protein D9758_003561 [Tetrapyrgos nigripes]